MTDAKRIAKLESQVTSLRARLTARTDQLLLVLLQIDDLKRAAPSALAAPASTPADSLRVDVEGCNSSNPEIPAAFSVLAKLRPKFRNTLARCSTAASREPRWACLEDMNADELAAYDYGCAGANAAILAILDGKDTGAGVSNEPWESIRRRLIALVQQPVAYAAHLDACPTRAPRVVHGIAAAAATKE